MADVTVHSDMVFQLKDEEERIENEPEWSLKNTLKRTIAYIFSLGFWVLGISIWKNDGSYLAIIILGIIGSSYVLFDIYVMWTKSKKASS